MADQIAETGANIDVFDNKNLVKAEASKISDSEKIELGFKLNQLKVSENIPTGSVVLDVGCGSGALGILAAANTDSSLVQADVIDRRDYKVGELLKGPTFTGVNADKILLVDVVHHIGGIEDVMKFVNDVSTGLKNDGKILILNAHPEGVEIVKLLGERINQDPQLKDRVKML